MKIKSKKSGAVQRTVGHDFHSMRLVRFLALVGLASLFVSTAKAADEATPPPAGWENVRAVRMAGGLRAFWNVGGAPRHHAEALKHGFDPVVLLGDYSDYPGK